MKLSEIATLSNQISSLKQECIEAFGKFFDLQEKMNEMIIEKFHNYYHLDWEGIKGYLTENGFEEDSTQGINEFSCGEFKIKFKDQSKVKPVTLCEFDVFSDDRAIFSGNIKIIFSLDNRDVCVNKNTKNAYYMSSSTREFIMVSKTNYKNYIEHEIKCSGDLQKQVLTLQRILEAVKENIDDLTQKITQSSQWVRCFEFEDNVRGELWSSIDEFFENEVIPNIYKCK